MHADFHHIYISTSFHRLFTALLRWKSPREISCDQGANQTMNYSYDFKWMDGVPKTFGDLLHAVVYVFDTKAIMQLEV